MSRQNAANQAPVPAAQCSNCGRFDPTHIEMYCSEKPQIFLRCPNEKCWAAAGTPAEHSYSCMDRKPCTVLSPKDPIHQTTIRLRVSTEREAIKRYVAGSANPVVGFSGTRVRSTIANDIEFVFNDKMFELHGPKTMNFRVIIAIQQSIVARIDVGFFEPNIIFFDVQPSIDEVAGATQLHQTAAILMFEENEKIDVESKNKIYHMQFRKQDGIYVCSKFENIQKDD